MTTDTTTVPGLTEEALHRATVALAAKHESVAARAGERRRMLLAHLRDGWQLDPADLAYLERTGGIPQPQAPATLPVTVHA